VEEIAMDCNYVKSKDIVRFKRPYIVEIYMEDKLAKESRLMDFFKASATEANWRDVRKWARYLRLNKVPYMITREKRYYGGMGVNQYILWKRRVV
jgi:hypothetical protein